MTSPKRHAPRGPLKARDNPIDRTDPMKPRCKATNRQGKGCGKWPIPGGTVCRMHGGAAPPVNNGDDNENGARKAPNDE